MTFFSAITTCLSKYVTFSGRARRAEYWWWVLFLVAINIVAMILDLAVFGTTQQSAPGSFARSSNIVVFYPLASLLLFLPSLSVTVRRLHDRDKSGWWYWLVLVPFIGPIILLIWLASRGTEGSNRFGSDIPFPTEEIFR